MLESVESSKNATISTMCFITGPFGWSYGMARL